MNKTFEEIMQEQPIILLDTGVGNRDLSSWYREYVYGTHSFSNINPSILSMVMDNVELIYSLFSNPKANTVEKVSRELENFSEIISRKFNHLEKNNAKSRKKYDGAPIENWYLQEETRAELYRLSLGYGQICDLASRKIMRPENSVIFDLLEKTVLETTRNTRAKSNLKKGYRNLIKQLKDPHTDEQLVAMALYLSVVKRTPNAIITTDSDIARVISRTYFAIKSGYRNLGAIAHLIKDNPVQIYHIKEGPLAYLKFDTSSPNRFFSN